jgi:Flp pilus assembly protein TadD
MSTVTDKLTQMRAAGLRALESNDLVAALASLRVVSVMAPKDAGAQKAYAAALIRSNRHKDGVFVLKKLLVHAPKDVEVHCVVAELLFGMLRYAEAKGHLEICLALDPRSENPHGVRARVLVRRMQRQLEEQLPKAAV